MSEAKFSLLEFLRSFNTGGKRDGLIEMLIQSHAKQINLLGALKELAVAARDFDGEVDKYEKLSSDFDGFIDLFAAEMIDFDDNIEKALAEVYDDALSHEIENQGGLN